MHVIDRGLVLDLETVPRSDSLSDTLLGMRFSNLDVVMLSNHERIQKFF